MFIFTIFLYILGHFLFEGALSEHIQENDATKSSFREENGW